MNICFTTNIQKISDGKTNSYINQEVKCTHFVASKQLAF